MRRRGQHFLVDSGVIERIADYAELSPQDRVLEIGPGTGNLTEVLAERAGRVYALEVDPDLASDLEGRHTNVEVIRGDALKVELPGYDKVVSNLPYQISTKVTLRLLRRPFSLAVLMYQDEFVKRMNAPAKTKEYGRLAVNVACYSFVEVMERVPRSAFRPQPRVRSTVVRLRPRLRRMDFDMDLFDELTIRLFSMRRKKVRNVLAGMGVDVADLVAGGALLDRRPEDLSSDEIVDLAREIGELKR